MHYVESSGFFSSYIFVSSVLNVVLRVRQLNGRPNMCVLFFLFPVDERSFEGIVCSMCLVNEGFLFCDHDYYICIK